MSALPELFLNSWCSMALLETEGILMFPPLMPTPPVEKWARDSQADSDHPAPDYVQ